MEVMVISIIIDVLGIIPKGMVKAWLRDWKIRYHRISRDNLDNSIIKIGQNTEKSPGDLSRLSDSQTLVKNNSS